MNLKQKQLGSVAEETVLQTIAESAAKRGCKFLEIGSWLGDSTVILGKVAKNHGGHLFCVDWWKGNVGTSLMDIASKADVFSLFWSRICKESLSDAIIPIRSKSDIAANILKKDFFDMVFIDADHRYEAVLKDIKQYAPLVNRNEGIFCGHDCEGHISDFDRSFLEAGKNVDCYESVHCGVVLAVGSTFKDYSINNGIWSVRTKPHGWEPTNLKFQDIKDRRQPIPPPVSSTKNYDLFRYGKLIYAVPNSLDNLDVTTEEVRNNPKVISAKTLPEVEKLVGERISSVDYPQLLDSHRGYNLVQYKNRILAMSQSLGDINLACENEANLKKYQQDKKCIISEGSLDEAKRLVDQLLYEALQKNIDDRDKIIAGLQADISKLSTETAKMCNYIKNLEMELSRIKSKWFFRLYRWLVNLARRIKFK